MPESDCKSLTEALDQLDQVAPGVPLLALGQTIFWDEPMKAGVAIAVRDRKRAFVAGVHDTDYFAKLGTGKRAGKGYESFPHNDTTTKNLWSAAAEFSALFGSETVVTRDLLQSGGLRIPPLEKARPRIMDEATEAWGWRGVVSLEENPPIAAEVPLDRLFPVLLSALDGAIQSSLSSLAGGTREAATLASDQLHRFVCDESDLPNLRLGQFYEKLLPQLYDFCAGEEVPLEATSTTKLLRFNSQTVALARFNLVRRFVEPASREVAREAYDRAIRGGSGQYELARFGSGAIPFDLVIPGLGRGTVRIGNRGVVIMTRVPQFLSLAKPLTSLEELAAKVEAKFGPNCALIGKAVSLIGMLGAEFSFVFHEGASSYVSHSRRFHQLLAEAGFGLTVHPILRVRYEAWNALSQTNAWIRLPEPFRRAFGTEELCGPSFAQRWHEVAREQETFLHELGQLRRPIELIRYLDRLLGGSWNVVADEYARLQGRLDRLQSDLEETMTERDRLYALARELRLRRIQLEAEMGNQFRAKIFEQEPTATAVAVREEYLARLEQASAELRAARAELRRLRERQLALVQDDEIRQIHVRRRSIELEAELKRMRLIRDAVISSKGLKKANDRPSAWWFPLVSPDGGWFKETMRTARAYLEPLT
jgi:hypothetical protein